MWTVPVHPHPKPSSLRKRRRSRADVPAQIPWSDGSSRAAARHSSATGHRVQTRVVRASPRAPAGKKKSGPMSRHAAFVDHAGRAIESQLSSGYRVGSGRTSTPLCRGPNAMASCTGSGKLARLPLIGTGIVPPLGWCARQARSADPPDRFRHQADDIRFWTQTRPSGRALKLRHSPVKSLAD